MSKRTILIIWAITDPGVSCCGILTSLFRITEMNERINLLVKTGLGIRR